MGALLRSAHSCDPPEADLAAIPAADEGVPLQAAIRRYDAEIHYADREVARLLDFLATRPEVVARLKQSIATWMARERTQGTPAPELSEADRARVRSLGYVQ